MDLKRCMVESLYFDSNSIKLPDYQLYRIDFGDKRYYYTFEDEKPIFYISNTCLLGDIMPESEILTKWKILKGLAEAERYCMERANYGNLMHAVFAMIMIERKFDLDTIEDFIRENEFFLDTEKPKLLPFWTEELSKDVLSFSKFCIESEIRPIIIETPLKSEKLKIGTALDFFGKIKIWKWDFHGEKTQKGEPKKTKKQLDIFAIIDFKSGKNHFTDETTQLQLAIQKQCLIENFPEYEKEDIYLFNFAPKAWRIEPSHHLTDFTDKWNVNDLTSMINWQHTLRKNDPGAADLVKIETFGKVVLDSGTIDNNYSLTPFNKLVKTKENVSN